MKWLLMLMLVMLTACGPTAKLCRESKDKLARVERMVDRCAETKGCGLTGREIEVVIAYEDQVKYYCRRVH